MRKTTNTTKMDAAANLEVTEEDAVDAVAVVVKVVAKNLTKTNVKMFPKVVAAAILIKRMIRPLKQKVAAKTVSLN